ncbi:MAG: hypothetical protein OEL66_07575, partial [Desulfobulbaceae bacterium]|nr:hypothetical protein [Desulfobulbaceae bacterium]
MTSDTATNSQRLALHANGLPTLIGSLPVPDHQQGLEMIFAHTPAIPLWPQLPGNPLEGMMRQFIEGMPGVVDGADRTYFDINTENFETELLTFFEEYLAVCEDPGKLANSRFSVSEERGGGLYRLREALAGKP